MEEKTYANTDILKGCQPENVFRFFEIICSIPHGSKNTKQISDWIVSVAKNANLKYSQDSTGNVIVWVPASNGYENVPGFILQGHMDMVAVKTAECGKNLDTDALELELNSNTISAKGTSLGGDDGIAVAYMLAIMTDDTLKHPQLELVFTTDEEIGLQGISAMDVSPLKNKKLINLDSEDEGVLIAGCAGGIKNACTLPVDWQPCKDGTVYELAVSGLLGGHSGMEIDKERGNANLIIARALWLLNKNCGVHLMALAGGEKDNAIPNSAKATFAAVESEETLQKIVAELQQNLRTELFKKDDHVTLTLNKVNENTEQNDKCVSDDTFNKILLCIMNNPNGVQAMSASVEGTVETSLNCGIMQLSENGFLIRYAIRSSIKSAKNYLQQKIQYFVEFLGGTVTTEGDYPPWEFMAKSPFRESVVSQYKKMYGKNMEVCVIHAGLECGYLSENLDELECISIGPDMKQIHTTDETLDIGSVKRVWEFLLEILQDKEN